MRRRECREEESRVLGVWGQSGWSLNPGFSLCLAGGAWHGREISVGNIKKKKKSSQYFVN